jgi:protein-L-isoaspartate(D-aspartate) O-methyltransferase
MNELDLSGIGMTSQRTRFRLLDRLRQQGIDDEKLLEIIGQTPRHIFIDEALSHRAYEDTALPIGFNQTISQPFIVALMTKALFQDGKVSRVLEIGTGCGYQTAILAQLADRVFTVERIKGLQSRARQKMKLLGLRNVQFRHSDGGVGWPEQAPFDGIIVTAAPRRVPRELVEQLAPDGRMVIPVGDADSQTLRLITLDDGEMQSEELEQVRFVPLLGGTK